MQLIGTEQAKKGFSVWTRPCTWTQVIYASADVVVDDSCRYESCIIRSRAFFDSRSIHPRLPLPFISHSWVSVGASRSSSSGESAYSINTIRSRLELTEGLALVPSATMWRGVVEMRPGSLARLTNTYRGMDQLGGPPPALNGQPASSASRNCQTRPRRPRGY